MSKINPFKWEKCPLQMGKMPLFIGKAVALQRGIFLPLEVFGLAPIIGKAVALQRGNFGALIYVIYMQ